MKKSLFFVLFALISVVSYSQISWNAKAGMNMSNITSVDGTSLKIGYNVGVGMEYAFNDTWAIQPSLMFTAKGWKMDIESADEEGTVKATVNPLYLQIPVMAAARFPISDNMNVVVSAGPYFAFGVGGKVTADGYEDGDCFGDEDETLGMERFDCGLGVGVALEISKFLINVNGEFGLTKVIDTYDKSPKNMNFSIGVGYKF